MAEPRQNNSPERARVRCAVYTRKSSEEGLEQEFNSLDAQREACEAYITSQKHEGWTTLATLYSTKGCIRRSSPLSYRTLARPGRIRTDNLSLLEGEVTGIYAIRNGSAWPRIPHGSRSSHRDMAASGEGSHFRSPDVRACGLRRNSWDDPDSSSGR